MATGQLTATIKDIFTGSAILGAVVETLDGSIVIDSQTTDASGVFTTGNLQLGSYELLVTKTPYQQVSIKVLVSQSLAMLADIYLQPLNIYGQKSDGTYQPINTNNMNALILSSLCEKACRIGNYYGATTGAQTIAISDFFAIELSNPPDSGRSVHLGNISGGMTTGSVIDIIKNGAFLSGTSVTTTKWNYGYTDDSVTIVKWITQATDPTVGGTLQTSIIQSGVPLVVDINGEIIIPPNNTMLIITKNPSTTDAQQIAITVTWWEENV